MNTYYTISEQDIQHHGILGMKWGIRRFQPYPSDYHGSGKEVGKAAKVQQRKNYKVYKNTSHSYGENLNVLNIVSDSKDFKSGKVNIASKELTKAYDDLKKSKVGKATQAWHQASESVKDKYRSEVVKEWGVKNKEEYDHYMRLMKESDIDQGMNDSFSRFTVKEGFITNEKELRSAFKEYDKLSKNYDKAVSDSIDSIVGKYGNKKIKEDFNESYRQSLMNTIEGSRYDAAVLPDIGKDYLLKYGTKRT